MAVPAADLAREFCVVGVGASAGGLEALRAFFSRMAAQPGFACVVVVHLSPEHESHLVQMLQPYTQMPVCQVVKTTALEPNHVYVIPPNANLNSIDTHLRLSQLEDRRVKRAPIDHFLRTLAETHGERAIGVILSGAGSDGALGMRQIKEHGGLTLAQHPREAGYSSMPQSAIATGTVDIVLPVRDMAGEIEGYCTTQPLITKRGRDNELGENEASLLEKILGEVRLRTGQEFAMFRREMVLRRVLRRMRLLHVSSLEAYFEALKSHSEEPRALHNDLLLNVTEFFRDNESYGTIERVLREILDRKDDHDQRVRIWSIGCSTGEEAYSLAMLLLEHTAARGDEPLLQVFASELASEVLQQAREGAYPQEIAASISQDRLERFFVQESGRYRVRRELRDMVTFANHDLFKNPPFAHLDLIVCRNLLRDLQPEMRRGVLNLFFYALEPHGMLVVDARDEIELPELFVRDRTHPELLRRKSGPARGLQLPSGLEAFARMSGERAGSPLLAERFDTPTLFRRATERYTPPSVLVDSRNRVVHFSATAARYVRIPGGEMTLDIFELVPDAIRRRLGGGLEVARSTQRSWVSEPFVACSDRGARRLQLRIDPLVSPRGTSELLLVVIDDSVEREESDGDDELQMLNQVRKLEAELQGVHAQLTVLARKPHGAHPDPVPHQENEEQLRSAVKELESAREELQAVNEELISVNHENRYRIDTLAELSNDLQHLLESTGFAMVLLDRDLKVVRFTPRAAALLRLRESDVGRPLTDLKSHLQYDTLVADLHKVAEQLSELETEAGSDDGRWYLLHAQPYRTARRGLEGISLLLVDITDRKRAELALQESDRRKEEFLAILAHELRNPLAPIIAGLEVLRRAPQNFALVRQITATMARQTKQLVTLVDDLLEVVRINEDKLTLRLQPVDIAEVVRDAVSATRPLIESLEHQLTIELPVERLTVKGDGARLMQVIGNLLNNAARYTPARGQIMVRSRQDGEHVLISVQDNGRGLSAQSLSKVFEMFYQGGESGTSDAGLGIGLTLAKKLVELHGGIISAESGGAGMGSTFMVRLPLAPEETADGTMATQNEPGDSSRPHRVLIVDDNTDAAETLRLLMESLGGGEVRTASNGTDALAAAATLHPDVVLLDLSMPGMDGYELARRMRAESWGKRALLVALTGWGQDQHRRRSHEAGFDRHVTKPADAEALRAVLNSR